MGDCQCNTRRCVTRRRRAPRRLHTVACIGWSVSQVPKRVSAERCAHSVVVICYLFLRTRGHPALSPREPRARGASGQTAPKSFVGNRLVSPSDMLKYTDEGVNVHVVCKASSTRY